MLTNFYGPGNHTRTSLSSNRSKLNAVGRATAISVCAAILGLAGCGANDFISGSGAVAASAGITGRVHGGQQPVSGAIVQLMEPGTTGYGSAPSLIVAAVAVTDAGGNFTLPRPYTCPANSGLVYVLATGGNAGAGVNSAIAEAAIVGNCASLTASTFVEVTEVTTVAAAYALAPFATITAAVTLPAPTAQSASIGTSATNLLGLYNAAGAAANLANLTTGFAHATGDVPGVVPPTNELNTLADILASCVNQGTPNNSSGNCSALFTAATPAGGLTPTDTFQAAIDIAKNPGLNVSTLYNLVPTNAPFQPTLTTAPNDFSVALGYNGGTLTLGDGNASIAIDATGNAWITTGFFNQSAASLTEITPFGAYPGGSAVATTSGFGNSILNGPTGVGIDKYGYIWVCNNTAGNLLKFNPGGATLNATITANSFYGVNSIAFDPIGDAWVANFGDSYVTEINTAGVEAANSPFAAGYGGVDVAVSPTAVWQTNYGSNYLYRIDLTSLAVTAVQIGGDIGDVAIDHSNNAWIAVTGNGSIFEISDSGGYVNTPYGGYQVAGTTPQTIAIDGLGNVFGSSIIGNAATPGSLLEYSNSANLLSPGTGFTGSNFIPVIPEVVGGTEVDGSGNVWIAGTSNGTGVPLYVAEIVGLAAPVVTPKSVATANNTLGTRP